MSEIMPAVLATYGLLMPDNPGVERTVDTNEMMAKVVLNAREEALAC
jgi:hypothetical protein